MAFTSATPCLTVIPTVAGWWLVSARVYFLSIFLNLLTNDGLAFLPWKQPYAGERPSDLFTRRPLRPLSLVKPPAAAVSTLLAFLGLVAF
jgi:hypothetical protein